MTTLNRSLSTALSEWYYVFSSLPDMPDDNLLAQFGISLANISSNAHFDPITMHSDGLKALARDPILRIETTLLYLDYERYSHLKGD